MTSLTRTCASVLLAVGLAAGLAASLAAGPASAGGPPQVNPPPVNPPPPSGGGPTSGGSCSGGTCTATVADKIALSGDANPGYNESWAPPDQCWLQPEFKQPQTYQSGDPSGGKTDADSYWFWFGRHFSGFNEMIHGTGSFDDINAEFKQEQDLQRPAAWTGPDPIAADDVWWAPNWLDTPAGWACAQALVDSDNLSDGFIGLEPPAQPGGGPQGAISGQDLAGLARAALRLPTVTVVTSPPVSTEVNLPTYVSVDYRNGVINPRDMATVSFADGTVYLSASVQANLSSIQITSNAPGYQTTGAGAPGQACAAANGKATSACGITFNAPSPANAPYTVTVTATWTVSWTATAGGQNVGGATFPPNPPTTMTGTSNVVVREIQSQT